MIIIFTTLAFHNKRSQRKPQHDDYMLCTTSEFKGDCHIQPKFHMVFTVDLLGVPLYHPWELEQFQCKPRNQTVQCQMHLSRPKILAANWMQLCIFGGQSYLGNCYLHTVTTAVWLQTHTALWNCFRKALNTQRTRGKNDTVPEKRKL